jgi:hypothetical protein
MSPPADRLRGLLRRSEWPTERDWERSALLQPRSAPAEPALVSDGTGLPFPPSALDGPAGELDREDAASSALIKLLARQKTPAGPAGWRVLARTDDEVLFGHVRPSGLVTVTMRRGSRREGWLSLAVNRDAALRTTRDGVRASGWRLDRTREPGPQDTVLRVLVKEQTRAGGARADGRLQTPDLHAREGELVLTMFVTPRGGIQQYSSGVETVARIELPEPLGGRTLVDGAIYAPARTL